MANQFYTFYYDPVREGFDSDSWRTLYGDPVVSSNRLELPYSSIIHYGDILRGDATFNMNIPTPSSGVENQFGFMQLTRNAYALFKTNGAVFTAEVSNGTNSKVVVINWDSNWSGEDTDFRIKWEAGMVLFYINGNLHAAIGGESIKTLGSDDSGLIPGIALSLYAANLSSNNVFLNSINVQGMQSYTVVTGNGNSPFQPVVYEVDRLRITEVITMATFGASPSASLSPSSSTSRSSSPSLSPSSSASSSVSPSLSPSSSASSSASLSLSPSSSDSSSVSRSTSPSASYSPSSSVSRSISPSNSVSPSAGV